MQYLRSLFRKHQYNVGDYVYLKREYAENRETLESVKGFFGANGDQNSQITGVKQEKDDWYYVFVDYREYPIKWFDEPRYKLRIPPGRFNKILGGIFVLCVTIAGALITRTDIVQFPSVLSPIITLPNNTPTMFSNPIIQSMSGTTMFEYGGVVSDTSNVNAARAMNIAGMTWMSVYVRYSTTVSADDIANIIDNAHQRGFKILLTIEGNAEDLSGGIDYMEQYANFLGEVAKYNPNAIEIWREQNVDRNWPQGQISGSNYTEMLKLAYSAIKSKNPDVTVISGALAPTGFFGGQCTTIGCADDVFLREMVQAGATQYMDCLGISYLEGITRPNQTQGDPREYFTVYCL